MCHLCVVNSNDELLNKQLLTILGDVGSVIQDDGFGIFDGRKAWKTARPFYLTTNAGEIIRRELPRTGQRPLALHLRQASPMVPVCNENSHPFIGEGFTLAHNGKLTPKKEEDFVLEEEVPDIDEKTGKQREDKKDGKLLTKKVKRSDSLIFFEHLLEIKRKNSDYDFPTLLVETMKDFNGKFAFIAHDGKKMYVVRGRSADLYISYLLEDNKQDAPVYGFVVNTSKDALLHGLLLASHVRQIQGLSQIHFSLPVMLEEETIFQVEKTDLKVLGKIKETFAPVSSTNDYWKGSRGGVAGASNFTTTHQRNSTEGGATSAQETETAKLCKKVWNFMEKYSLSPLDIQYMFFAYYGISLKQAELSILRHFTKKIIPHLCSGVKKQVRKDVYKSTGGHSVGIGSYKNGDQYPWVYIPKNLQPAFAKRLQGDK